MTYTVAQLESMLADAKKAERDELEARRKSVTPEYKFTLEKVNRQGLTKSWDETIIQLELSGVVTNRAEMESVGNPLDGGGMTYLFNTVTGKFVCGGAGRSWIGSGLRSDGTEQIYADLSEAWLAHPSDVIDVTALVNAERVRRGDA